ncbi:hypothetical protein L2K70_05420 [Nocardioides KLBMP 9356]|uniref:Ig-like domain repeat protein n=1 Tax=Nocardioides potassii TaxID=2911371 RepID=A0ABS9HAJ3_9ACTN|nr:hypothetical protein [Nocardioides potassii]MCF6377033.1 hypothetical protein [Nocardioides potassii]
MKLISGLAAVALAASTLAQAVPATAATSAQAADAAGDWIAAEVPVALAGGAFTYNPGQLIDAGLALSATGHQAEAEDVSEALDPFLVTTEKDQYGYVKADEYEFVAPYTKLGTGRYANPTAKATAFTLRAGLDPATQYSDVDLEAQLEDLTNDTTGRIEDDSTYGNYANNIGQGFAVEALANLESTETAKATDALLAQQCPAGFFPLDVDEPCATSPSQPDVTALVVISLVESGLTTPAVTEAIADAADWLESLQLADGSFPGDGGAAGANTNGTGLGGWALGEAGRSTAAAEAGAWTRALQVSDAGACATQAPTGAIAYNAEDFAAGRANGLGTARNTWRIASYQAAPALAWAPAASGPLAISTPATAAGSSTVTATVTGLAAGEYGCITFGSTARSVKGTGAPVTETFTLPAGPGSSTFTVTTLTDTKSSTTTVPAPTAPTANPTPTPVPVVVPTGSLKASKVELVRKNKVRLGVKCVGTETCEGRLVVRSKKAVGTGADAKRIVVARAAYSVEAGTKDTLVLKVRRAARPALQKGRLRVVATQSANGADTVRTAFWLKKA